MREPTQVPVNTLASMSPAERAKILFLDSDRYKLIGNLSHWQKANPGLYNEARALAEQRGTVGENSQQLGERTRKKWADGANPRSYSQDELVARAMFTHVALRLILNGQTVGTPLEGKGGIGEFAKNDPVGYAQMQLALASFGYGHRSVQEAEASLNQARQIPPPVEVPNRHAVTESMQKQFDLPEGTVLDDASLEAAAAAAQELARQEAAQKIRALAAAQVEAEQADKVSQ